MSHRGSGDARDRDGLHGIPADSSRRAAIAVLDRGAIGFEDRARSHVALEATELAAD